MLCQSGDSESVFVNLVAQCCHYIQKTDKYNIETDVDVNVAPTEVTA